MAAPSTKTPAKAGAAGRFFREVRAELKKVDWPNRKEIIIYTGVVLFMVLVVAIITGIVDSLVLLALTFFKVLGG